MEPIVIIGAGGFGREVYALIEEINRDAPSWNVIGFSDDNRSALDPFAHYPPVRWPINVLPLSDCRNYVCAVGDPGARKAILERLAGKDLNWPALLHPTAAVGPGSTVGAGTILCRGAFVTVDATIGDHVHLNMGSTVGHDAAVGSFCTLACHADVCGAATLAEGVFLGSQASVLPKAKVGQWARVGAGSVVLRTVKARTTVFGVPAAKVSGQSHSES